MGGDPQLMEWIGSCLDPMFVRNSRIRVSTNVRNTTWAHGVGLIDEVAHAGDGRFSTVVITPAIDGWTLVIGAWCGLPYLTRTALVTNLCQQLSSKYGRAQAYFHSEQNDGEAWLIAEDGDVIRQWVAEYPELALGEPFGVERHLLDAFGIPGKPEDLDPEDDRARGCPETGRPGTDAARPYPVVVPRRPQ
ncbi:hypothetical protein ACWET9_47385 [Streptomyces sp. NPDC004059]